MPRTAGAEEMARWADTVPYLGERITEAISLLGGHSIGFGEHFFTPNFPDGVLAAEGAALVAHYAERIRNSAATHYVVSHQVQELIEGMRSGLGDAAVQQMVTAATDRGFLGGGAT